MVDIHGFSFLEVAQRMGLVAETFVAEGEHIEAVDTVGVVETSVPDLEVGEADCEIVHHYLVVEMLFAVINEAVEIGACLLLVAERAECETGVEDFVGLGIVVVHCGSGFCRAESGERELLAGLLLVAETAVAEAEQIVEVVLLRSVELALAEIMGVDETLLEQADGFL